MSEHAYGTSIATPDKQDGFTKYLSLHSLIVRAVWNRNRPSGWRPPHRRYVYIDTHAGSGSCGEYGDGSPIRFLDLMYRHSIPFNAHFIEREHANAEALRGRISARFGKVDAVVHEADNQEVIASVLAGIYPGSYGLLYMDPYGLPTTEVLVCAAAAVPKIDLLVRVPTRAIKRVRGAHDRQVYLTDMFRSVAKEKWLIRAPMAGDRFDWTFLFGTNYSDWREWKKERFFWIGSQDGQRILHELNYTDAERLAMVQPNLDMMDTVKSRSGGTCELCQERAATEVHHYRYGGDLDPSKVVHVCHECHCRVEGVAS